MDPRLKIACTLRYMATGNDFTSYLFGFRVAQNTLTKFVPEETEAIIKVFFDGFSN